MTHDDTEGHGIRQMSTEAPSSPDGSDDTEGHGYRHTAADEVPPTDLDDDDVVGHVQPNRLRDRDS